MPRSFTLFLLLIIMNNAIAMQQVHGVIPSYETLVAGDSFLLESKKKFNNDFKGYDFTFPKQKYIIDPMLININDEARKYPSIVARGVLELQSYHSATGIFKFKLVIDNLAFSQAKPILWSRNKTDIPIKGILRFDINNNNDTILEGKYNQSTKEIIPTKSKDSIFYIDVNFGTGIRLGRVNEKKDIPVTIDVE